ncbi:hypothetical protein BJP41_09190 [Candidatus Williamhamiltonella defendens]|uniref:Uncharacterized protein n=1 Tax=Candidatus Williamhamiltonella defendens TaxID=138072 RepID=A0A2D3T3T5_9ENTR|nr:hypothetical protein CJJ18_09570 [Candidatus Hamiltonella defensa]ATW30469.1 hypothetical protein BJP41_09190 [Candidatus Hamiltonella defensa]AWK17114.1 hypothetical protein CCS40_09390 [Candidatus Hamiltonella defensa]
MVALLFQDINDTIVQRKNQNTSIFHVAWSIWVAKNRLANLDWPLIYWLGLLASRFGGAGTKHPFRQTTSGNLDIFVKRWL